MAGECTFSPDLFHTSSQQFTATNFLSPGDYDVFSVLEADLDGVSGELTAMRSRSSGALQEVVEARNSKRLKLSTAEDGGGSLDGQQRQHITVERNRRKQMNEYLRVLRSLMPCFYVKRGDQASIIEGVVDYITELQQTLLSLEAKKQRNAYSEVMSARVVSRGMKLPLSPRPNLSISPRTPPPILTPNSFTTLKPSNELVANSRSAIAEVKVKFEGGNLILTTCSNRVPGQVTKVIAEIENLALEVLQANISIVDETMVSCFTIKIGVECQLSAEELAQHIQQTFG